MTLCMLDTCVCVALLRGRAGAAAHRLSQLAMEAAGLSAISLAELRFGAARSADPPRHAEIIKRFLVPLAVWPFDSLAADIYGTVRAELERRGRPIGPLDTLIAAHALSLGATLVTGNHRDFRRVPGLLVENWTRG